MKEPPVDSIESRIKNRYHHGNLPEALKKAAMTLIKERGIESFSMREAAAAIGVSPSAVYRHFNDKRELLAAISRDGFDALSTSFEKSMAKAALASGTDPAIVATAHFMAQGKAYVAFALAEPQRFQVMFGHNTAQQTGSTDRNRASETSPFKMLSQVLDTLVDAGVINIQARVGAEIFVWSSIHGLACLLVADVLEKKKSKILTEQLVNHILAGLKF